MEYKAIYYLERLTKNMVSGNFHVTSAHNTEADGHLSSFFPSGASFSQPPQKQWPLELVKFQESPKSEPRLDSLWAKCCKATGAFLAVFVA